MTDDEIKAVYNRYPFAEQRMEFARAIIAAYQAKLRAVSNFPKPPLAHTAEELSPKTLCYTARQFDINGDARDQAGYLRGLEDAKRVVDSVLGENNISAAIDKLKGGE